MSPRFARLAAVAFAAALAALPLPAAAEPALVAMRVQLPADAAIADVNSHAGETSDLCAPGEQLRREGDRWVCEARRVRLAAPAEETYQTFEVRHATAGAPQRFAAACLGREDRVIGGSCVRRAAGGYVSFAGRLTSAQGGHALECALDGAESEAAVGIAICLDVPPHR
jgi:hypothetical protein